MKTFTATRTDSERAAGISSMPNGKTLGRLATELARRLRGKHKPEYTPHVDTGDYIVVVNAEKIRVTGRKLTVTRFITAIPGISAILSRRPCNRCWSSAPERALTLAVKGMLPRNALGRQMLKKLKVVSGESASSRGATAGCSGDIIQWRAEQYYGTGRRKSAAARVFLTDGNGADSR